MSEKTKNIILNRSKNTSRMIGCHFYILDKTDKFMDMDGIQTWPIFNLSYDKG